MKNQDAVLIICMYITLISSILWIEIREIKKKNTIMFHNYISFFLILFYCITPIINIYYEYLAKEKIEMVNYMTTEAKFYYMAVIMTAITYICLRLGYKIKTNIKKKEKKEAKKTDINSKNFSIAAIILCMIGWTSIILWTKAYGMPWDIFPYASEIRSGIVRIYNPYTFVKPFCPIVVIATYCFWLILVETKKKHKWIYVICMIISAFGSVIYFIANDGRLMIILFFLVPILYITFRKGKKINYLKIGVICILTLILLGNLDNITYYFRNGEKREKSATTSVVNVISEELTFVHMNVINTLYMREKQIVTEYTCLQDIKNIFFAWVPERFKPDSIVTLYELNTSKYPNTTGTLPTDLITAGIYKYGSVAFFVLPLIVGIMIRLLESFFERNNDNFNSIIMILLSVYLALKINGYYDLSCILFGVFYIAISYIIVKIVGCIKMEEK